MSNVGALLLCRAQPESVAPAAHLLRDRMLLAPAGDAWSVLLPEGRPWLHGGEPVDRPPRAGGAPPRGPPPGPTRPPAPTRPRTPCRTPARQGGGAGASRYGRDPAPSRAATWARGCHGRGRRGRVLWPWPRWRPGSRSRHGAYGAAAPAGPRPGCCCWRTGCWGWRTTW